MCIRDRPIPVEPIKEQQQPNEEIVKFEYYGTECAIRINNEVRNMLSNLKNDNSNLSKVWTSLSDKGVLNNTIRDCLSLRISLSLCDWAYLNLLFSLSKVIFSNCNETTMLTSYIYCQSGYRMRLGRNGQNLYLLYASEHGIYDMDYFKIDNIKYYPSLLSR